MKLTRSPRSDEIATIIDQGADLVMAGNTAEGCKIWLAAWEKIKDDARRENWTLAELEDEYSGSFFLSNFIHDLEMELGNAGLKDPSFHQKRIEFCREILASYKEFSKENEVSLRRAIAEEYLRLGDFERCDAEYEFLVAEHPDDPWGYIGWGDSYDSPWRSDKEMAREKYEQAKKIARDNFERSAVRERLVDLWG